MPQFLLALLMILGLVFAAPARAETVRRVRKTTTTVITKESEGDQDGDVVAPIADPVSAEPKESVKTATFGSKGQSGTAGCKTDDLAKSAVKDLKTDCSAWVKDQKSELKGKFLTSSCDESCDDCGMSLRRCSVTGAIHYLLK
jgi:hypothetical protein